MISYDENQPLIAIHVPKSAGTSVRKVFGRWFHPSAFFRHYHDEEKGRPPRKVDLREIGKPRLGRLGSMLNLRPHPVCIYGHFPRARGYGIEELFPEVRQFVTILRDPFETAVSNYHYLRRVGERWVDRSHIPQTDLRSHLMNTPSTALDHFPRAVTAENYRSIIDEWFIDIGISEQLEESLRRIALKLGKKFDPVHLGRLNVTDRPGEAPDELKDLHRVANPLDYLVYEYVREKFN